MEIVSAKFWTYYYKCCSENHQWKSPGWSESLRFKLRLLVLFLNMFTTALFLYDVWYCNVLIHILVMFKKTRGSVSLGFQKWKKQMKARGQVLLLLLAYWESFLFVIYVWNFGHITYLPCYPIVGFLTAIWHQHVRYAYCLY